MRSFISLVSGVIFSIGLGMSGMTQPQIVRGFLDFFGSWDWRLMGVIMGAVVIHIITYRLIIKRPSPVLDDKFHLPSKKHIDIKLILGAMLFGLGWGWAGICPGPGLVSLASGNIVFFYFIGSMLAGMFIYQQLDKKFISQKKD